jgi:hypothetical protein
MTVNKPTTIMSFWHKSARGALLGLMLLLTGTAPLFIVAVDNDNDDEPPPVQWR